jgi:hypothetical protein
MKVVAFITEYAVVDRIIDYLKLTFVADRPPPCSPHVFHEGRRLMSSSRLRSWRPLRPVLKETCWRLHECGRGERGVFLIFRDLREWESVCFRPARKDFPSKAAFRASIFVVIDIAARPAIVFHHDQEGRFIARSGHSPRRGKRNFLSLRLPPWREKSSRKRPTSWIRPRLPEKTRRAMAMFFRD